jgi:ABC-2 type transport system ATP-binding protein
VFVSSHLLAEVEQICSHVGVMRTGRLVFQGALPELRRTGVARIRVETRDVEIAVKVLVGLGLAGTQAGDGEASALLAGPDESRSDGYRAEPEQVCAELVRAGVGIRSFGVVAPSLEDLFVGLTGEGFNVGG